jgi:hypothetical protein
VTLEGVSHFHSWHVPRLPDATGRGVTLLGHDQSCSQEEAVAAAEALRIALR